eukprot:12736404-Alexandrium_andersonii.AAC.1
MSASLVGSEMCIRDSACAGNRKDCAAHQRSNFTQPHQRRRELGWTTHGAVSYTHLTLPTICSV